MAFKETIMKQVLIFLFSICFFIPAIAQNERLIIPWPETWKIGSQEKTHTMSMVELIPNNEKIDQWTIIGTTTILTNIKCGTCTYIHVFHILSSIHVYMRAN